MRMRGTVAAVFRPRPMRCLVYLFGLGAVALVLCLPLLVIIGRNPRVLWPVAAAVWVLLLLPVARVRCVVTDDGIAVQNYLRTYWLPSPELTEVKLWPPKVLSLTFFPGQMVPSAWHGQVAGCRSRHSWERASLPEIASRRSSGRRRRCSASLRESHGVMRLGTNGS